GEGAAKIDYQAFDGRARQHEAESDFRLGVSLTADFEKIRRLAAAMGDYVHRGHGQAGAVGEHADIAAKLDEFQPGLGAASLKRGEGLARAGAGEIALPEERGVIEHELAVERDDAPVLEQRQRIDLDQFGVARAVNRVE